MNGEKKAILSLCLGACLLATPALAGPPQAWKTVKVTILRLAQIDNLDKGDQLTRDDADFYAVVTINGQSSKSLNMSRDDGKPGWVFTESTRNKSVKITIRVMDDDGGLEDKDDHVDINTKSGKKDLSLTYNLATGRVTGDARGRRNQKLHSGGIGDGDKAQIWFKVQ